MERLSRYVLRPPLAKARIERRADGTVRLGMKRAWSDGTLAFEFSPLEFVEKLAAILLPPRKNQVIYHGVLAGNSNASGDCAETDSTARTLENALQTVKKSCSTPENSTGCASEALGRIAGPCFWSGCVSLSELRRTHGVSLHGGRAGDAEGSGRSGAFAGTAVEVLEVRRPGGVAERHAGPEGGGVAEVGISGEWRGV